MAEIITNGEIDFEIVEVESNQVPIIQTQDSKTEVFVTEEVTIIQTSEEPQTVIYVVPETIIIEVSDCGIQGPPGPVTESKVLISETDPSLSNTIESGLLWWSPITNQMKIYYEGTWVNFTSTAGSGFSNRDFHYFTTIEDQTVINLSYTPGNIDVYVNGILVKPNFDYVATNSNEVIFLEPMKANWTITIVEFNY